MRRIGIDVGGTNTDAVLIAGNAVVRSVKAATTADLTRRRDLLRHRLEVLDYLRSH